MRYFDIDGDNALNYQEFLQMILPCDDLNLRAEAAQRQAGRTITQYKNGERIFMSYAIERGLCDFLETEIHLNCQLESLKMGLVSSIDWNLHLAFQAVDTTRDGFLNYRNI